MPIYLILFYKDYKEERKELINRLKDIISKGVSSLPILLNIKKGIESILVFLKETSISTRNWHLSRIEDIEEDKEEEEDLDIEI